MRGAGTGGYPAPAFTAYYFFLAVFFFELPFFFAFFFAAILVSFKVTRACLSCVCFSALPRTILRTLYLLLFHRSPEKISEKPCTVRQFYATAQKKCNTLVKYF